MTCLFLSSSAGRHELLETTDERRDWLRARRTRGRTPAGVVDVANRAREGCRAPRLRPTESGLGTGLMFRVVSGDSDGSPRIVDGPRRFAAAVTPRSVNSCAISTALRGKPDARALGQTPGQITRPNLNPANFSQPLATQASERLCSLRTTGTNLTHPLARTARRGSSGVRNRLI